jgi:hypothetical protein
MGRTASTSINVDGITGLPNTYFWTDTRPADDRGWMGRGRANVARWNAAHAPAEPDVTAPEPTDYLMDMSLDDYAAQRSSMPVANDFGLIKENTSGFADAKDLMGSATALAAMTNPYRRHDWATQPGAPRGVPASSMPESLGGIRPRGAVS